MKKFTILITFLIFGSNTYAKEFISSGRCFRLKEEELLTYLESSLENKKPFGLENADLFKADMEGNPNIQHAKERRNYYVDVTYTAKDEVKLEDGEIIVRKGELVNPLEDVTLSTRLIFIDGTDQKQVDWAVIHRKSAKLILVKGNPMEAIKKKRTHFFHDQYGAYSKKFQIQHVPAIVSQEGNRILVEEFPLEQGVSK